MPTPSSFRLYVGIDWATDAHQICLIDADRSILAERSVEHNGSAIGEFVQWLAARGDPATTAIAIEVPRGAVVEILIERGFAVFAINPKQLDRFRDRHTVAGAKDDRRDAFVLADSLRTDEPCFHRLRVDDPITIQLREYSRIEEDLRTEMNRLCNRLRDQLVRFFPQVLKLSASATDPWVWELLEIAPDPATAVKIKPRRIAHLLRENKIRRLTAEQVIAELRAAPLFVAPGATEAARAHIALLIPRLRLAWSQRKECAAEMGKLLDQLAAPGDSEEQKREHRDVDVLRSLPGVGRVVAATMLAEASQPLEERDYHALRSLAGVAPITRQSGRHHSVAMRKGCNRRLRWATYHWARVSAQKDKHSRELYAGMRARGHTHGRALRGVADRLLSLLVAMLKSSTLYDPTRRRDTAAASSAA